jgi:hypothetical protein
MTANEFREIALSFPETVEASHMDHPDFRVRGKIFATLGYPNADWGMVGLTPEEQARVTKAEPDVFLPAKGAWGRAGSTGVLLRLARKESIRKAMEVAWKYHGEKAASRKKTTRKVSAGTGKSATTR